MYEGRGGRGGMGYANREGYGVCMKGGEGRDV